MKFDFLTIGGATEDITFYTKEGILINNKKDVLRQNLLAFEYGAKIKVDRAYSTFGGGAANTAVSFSKLGFRVATILSLGADDRGDRIIKNLQKNKVYTKFIKRTDLVGSSFSFLVAGSDNEHIVFSHRAANDKLEINSTDLKRIKSAKWIHLTSLSGDWKKVLQKIFSINDIKISWNPGYRQLSMGVGVLGKYFKKTSVLLINKDEAIELVLSDKKLKNKDNKFLNNTRNLLRIIKAWGPEIVVITSGQKGADAFDGEKFYHQDILKEKRREDTTGVGDAFGSTFVAGFKIFKGDIQKAMHAGVKNTASVIGEQGAQNGLLNKKEIL